MYELKKKLERLFTSKLVGTGPRLMEKRIYRAAVSQRLRNTAFKPLHVAVRSPCYNVALVFVCQPLG